MKKFTKSLTNYYDGNNEIHSINLIVNQQIPKNSNSKIFSHPTKLIYIIILILFIMIGISITRSLYVIPLEKSNITSIKPVQSNQASSRAERIGFQNPDVIMDVRLDMTVTPTINSSVVDSTETINYLPLIQVSRPMTFYVSRTGSNGDGKTWASAWNELDQIEWDVIQPGDTILIDGGSSEMVYQTSLIVGKSGVALKPISIRLADETGRNGRVIIFGGRSNPLPYCGQTDYAFEKDDIQPVGILIDDHSWINVDGRKWKGITIFGHRRNGIRFKGKPHNILIRNIEIYDNGGAHQNNGKWEPDGAGVDLMGTNIAFERAIVHDNGQDAFQSGGIVENFHLKKSWLYNNRPHPDSSEDTFNLCRHTDGIQIFDGGDQYGLVVEDSIIGPGLLHGFILGDYGKNHMATVHDVTIRNTLIVHHHGENNSAGLTTKHDPDDQFPNNAPTNYTIDRVTVVRDPNTCENPVDCLSATWFSIKIRGLHHTITNSIFYGGTYIRVEGNPLSSNNIYWLVEDQSQIANQANPMFADDDFIGVGGEFDFDFTVQNPYLPKTIGTSITSVDVFFNQSDSN